MGQYCFARWRLLSVVVLVCNAAGGRPTLNGGPYVPFRVKPCSSGYWCFLGIHFQFVLRFTI